MSRDPLIEQIGARIRVARLHREMSLQRLAAEIGLTYQQVQKYENGSNRVSVSMLLRIAQALNTDIAIFFDDLEEGHLKDLTKDQDVLQAAAALGRIKDPEVRARLCRLIETLAEQAGHD